MSKKILSLAILWTFYLSTHSSIVMQPRVSVKTSQVQKYPDIRKMIEEKENEDIDNFSTTVSAHGPGAVYRLVEDPITRQFIVKSNVVEVKPEEPKKVYALDIKDLYILDSYLKNLRDQIKIEVFGDLPMPPNSNKLDRGYAFYKNLNKIRDQYYINKSKIDEKIDYLKKVTDFALEFTKNASETDLVNILSEKDVDIDTNNRFILTQLIEHIAEEMNALHKAISVDMSSYFAEFDKVASDKMLSVYTIIEKSSQIAFKLTILEQEELDDRINRIIHIRQLIMDNKYYHHISASFDKELALPCSANISQALFFLAVITLLI